MKNNHSIEERRHSLAHLLAAAVLHLWPDTKPTIGPAVDNGFYYDFDFSTPITEKDLKTIEQKMKELLNDWVHFSHREVTKDEASEIYSNNPYKSELIREIADKGEKITLYSCGGFEDLCRGGHVENPASEIGSDSFKLSHIAGAYWRGNEKNKMLTRIYGLAFSNKQELEKYEAMIEEAKKRDHKILGPQLDLFIFSPLVGPGLPLWTPRGTLVRNLLDGYVWKLRRAKGYEQVDIPHIAKKDLYVTSGHWDKYKDDLYKITTREKHEFAMKPMNCPHHTQIYARKLMSYRELPQRYASTTKVYRDEQSGELAGLSRVIAITQDDAHVFCRMSQVNQEVSNVWDIIEEFYGTFGFTLRVRISLSDPSTPEKYLGGKERWAEAEKTLREVAVDRKVETFDGIGEAAFYGPKLDFMASDAIGREHQVATIQLDMNQPERFDLSCVNEKGEHERVVMIHAAIMGSIERFMAVLIEHTAGLFPFWLAPLQIKVLPITDTHKQYAEEIANLLLQNEVRVTLDDASESLGKKIRNAKVEKVPYFIVIGDEELKSKTITIESRDSGKVGTFKIADALKYFEEQNNPTKK